MENYNYRLPYNLSGFRIDKAIVNLIPNISRSRIQKSIENCHVKLNNIIINDSAYKVKENDIIEIILLNDLRPTKMLESNIPLDIIYEDKDIIVINKPVGLTVHPGAGNYQDTLANALLYYSKSLSNIGGYFRPGIAHRLDKDTSGLMIVAKNNEAHIKIALQIEKRELIRQYIALVWGIINPSSGTIESNIGRDRISRQKMTVLKTGGKKAITKYHTKEVFANGLISLITCELKTGRTHQIRVHLSHLGHSIIGDQTYGHNNRKITNISTDLKPILSNLKRQALHSSYLGFIHPVNEKFLEFKVDPPTDISRIIDTLKM